MKDVFGGRNIQYIQPNQSFPHHWYVSSLRHIWVSKRTCHTRARTQNFLYDFINPRQNVKNWCLPTRWQG